MKIVRPPIQALSGIVGAQKYKEKIRYRRTRHQIAVPCEDGTLLYHTLTGELLLLEAGESEETCREELIRRWFLIPQDFDECKQSDGVRRVAKLLQRPVKERTNFTILTTTDCNARCFYCYEKGISRCAMTEETARDVGEYVARVSGGKKVRLSWFGGEPLYNVGVIDVICGVLQAHGVEYTAKMTSNGYYLDAQTAQKAVRDWHLQKVQITLDGTEPVYNRTKAYVDRDGGSPFRRVMGNIESALDVGLEVTIRLNMDRANAEDLLALVDQIAQRFGSRPNLFGKVALLYEFSGRIHAFSSPQEAGDHGRRLQEKLDRCGLGQRAVLNVNPHFNQCMADADNCEVILPDGRIERCEHIRDTEAVGTIYNEARDTEKVQAWKETTYFPECMECALYPRCVLLKKCEWNRNGCSETRRDNNRRNARAAILAAYRQLQETAGRGNDEAEPEVCTGGNRW